MKFINSIILLYFLMVATESLASPVKRQFRDQKLATQQMIEKQTIVDPAAAATADLLLDDAGNTSAAAASQSTFLVSIDIPRNISILPGSTTADVASCTIVATGTDFHGKALTENFVFAANASTATVGSKAFKTLTKIDFPANCEDSPFGATWSVGFGEKLGLKRCLDQVGHVVHTTVSGTFESTRATIAKDASIISGNTADFNGTMDGAADFEIFFFQNFDLNCFP